MNILLWMIVGAGAWEVLKRVKRFMDWEIEREAEFLRIVYSDRNWMDEAQEQSYWHDR